jgi:hypothetical protein
MKYAISGMVNLGFNVHFVGEVQEKQNHNTTFYSIFTTLLIAEIIEQIRISIAIVSK